MSDNLVETKIQSLIAGYRNFHEHYFDGGNSSFAELVHRGQKPKALMIACSDSRVDPAIVMDCAPGDLFMIRNVANLVPPYEADAAHHGTSAALEFGVCVLEIPHVILFGHTQCGGIKSLLEHSHETCCASNSFLPRWMDLAQAAHDAVMEHHQEASLEEKILLCGRYSLVNSLQNLKTFPWIVERVAKGTLKLHAWNFHMAEGNLEAYDEEEHNFKVIV